MLKLLKENINELIICSFGSIILLILTFNFEIYEATKGFPLPNMFLINDGILKGVYVWGFPLTIVNFLIYLVLIFFVYKIFFNQSRISN